MRVSGSFDQYCFNQYCFDSVLFWFNIVTSESFWEFWSNQRFNFSRTQAAQTKGEGGTLMQTYYQISCHDNITISLSLITILKQMLRISSWAQAKFWGKFLILKQTGRRLSFWGEIPGPDFIRQGPAEMAVTGWALTSGPILTNPNFPFWQILIWGKFESSPMFTSLLSFHTYLWSWLALICKSTNNKCQTYRVFFLTTLVPL